MHQRAAGEDRELCDRWRTQGRRLVAVPGAVVRHAHALGFWGFCRQHYSYGVGAWQFRVSLASRGGGRVRVEPLSFYARLLAWPVRKGGASGLVITALLVVAQVANVVGFVCQGLRKRVAPELTARRVPR